MKRRAVAHYLKRARVNAGFPTQAAFAKAAGVTQQQISNYEKTGRVPQENVARIARALDVPVDELAMMLVEAAEEDERTSRRQNETMIERLGPIAERFVVFADKYEELGHTYASLDSEIKGLRKDAHKLSKQLSERLGRMEERLDALERRLPD